MKTTEQIVIRFIENHSLIRERDKVLITLSGGPDSVFALHFFIKYQKKYKIKLAAVHINHNLRGIDSDNDEKFCRRLCKENGIELFVQSVNVKELKRINKQSTEEAARELRYRVFNELSVEHSFDKIVTAHNQSDNTETVLLNLIKGTGLSGLSGIPVKRESIIRPMLSLSKEKILDYLVKNNIKYRIDASNKSEEYQRNILREKIISVVKEKINPALDETVFRSSSIVKQSRTIIDERIDEIIKDKIIFSEREIVLPISLNGKYGEEITREVLKKSLSRFFNFETGAKDIFKVCSLFGKQAGKSVELKNGISAYRERDEIKISPVIEDEKVYKKISPGSSVKIGNKKLLISFTGIDDISDKRIKDCELIDSSAVSGSFVLRNWKDGDMFIPLGMKNFKKISDFLTDEKVKPSEKKNRLVLTNRNRIVWVLGLRIDERFKITNKTTQAVKLCLK